MPPDTNQLKIEHIPVADLREDPSNVNTHDERSIRTIAASLKRFGLRKPIVVNDENVVIAGNGTLLAARLLGWKTIACVHTDLTGSDAQAFAIADNRIAQLANWDHDGLADMLKTLGDEGIDLGDLGWDAEEVAGLTGLPPNADGREFDESCAADVAMCKCPECGAEFPA